MSYRLSAAVTALLAVALLFGACRPIESSSRTTDEELSDGDGTVTSVNKVYIVQRGDTLYSIAKSECGSGAAVDALVEVNIGRRQPDGRVMKDPDLLRPGWELVLSCQTVRD